jgi:hypothetical protein
MADTIRTLVELNSLLADNTGGAISPQDVRDLMVSMMVHAEIGGRDKASVSLSSGWNTLDLDEDGVAKRGFTTDLTNHRVGGTPVAMKATLHWDVTFRGVVGEDYEFTVWRNGGTSPEEVVRVYRQMRILNASQVGHLSAEATVQCIQGDTFELAVRSGTNGFELLFGVLRLERIGVE